MHKGKDAHGQRIMQMRKDIKLEWATIYAKLVVKKTYLDFMIPVHFQTLKKL